MKLGRYLLIIIMLIIVFSNTKESLAQTQDINLFIYKQPIGFTDLSGYPFIDSANRIQVPFRQTMETFGCSVSWDEKNKLAIAEKEGIKVKIPIGESFIYKNEDIIETDTAAVIKDSRIYLPMRVVFESYDQKVSWDNVNRNIFVENIEIADEIMDKQEEKEIKEKPKTNARSMTFVGATRLDAESYSGSEIVAYAQTFLGVSPYLYGGATPDGFDCSGFTMYILSKFGISLPHSSVNQYAYGDKIGKEELQGGDLVFFKTNSNAPIGHVGIYIGDDQFIHSPKPGEYVKLNKLSIFFDED